ncbi:MAG: DeoR/GlpR family DNA-binding transcription regulator [Clostridia bacterium]|nr:DeoR/GlpR family DNA-binding transcription regulator [Clostridia bacterium]
MLAEERFSKILKLLEEKKAVTVLELTKILNISESTIRRDLNVLNSMGKLNKVHGGAVSISALSMEENDVSLRYNLNADEKMRIAKYAAQLIKENDFVYMDAGTTTEAMVEYITEKNAVYVTCGISLAKKLAYKGCKVYIIAGKIKAMTEAVIGGEAVESLDRYHFNIGFFGANGISTDGGFSTPDIEEARTKTKAMSRCRRCCVVADSSKFNKMSAVTFADIEKAEIITSKLEDGKFRTYTSVMEVG